MHEDAPTGGSADTHGMARRSFLKRAIGVLSALLATVIVWPLVTLLVGPIYRRQAGRLAKVPGFKSAPHRATGAAALFASHARCILE